MAVETKTTDSGVTYIWTGSSSDAPPNCVECLSLVGKDPSKIETYKDHCCPSCGTLWKAKGTP
jgi:hypothetical protein